MAGTNTLAMAYNIPRVRIGDLVRFRTDSSMLVLITFEVPDEKKDDDQWWYGGVSVGSDYHEPLWINVLDWAVNPDSYDVVGHININKAKQ